MKILAVDDDPTILELLLVVLTGFGYGNIHFAKSAADALQLVETESVPYDCFLLDIKMPEMDGIQLTSILRGYDGYSKTPILMVTAMSDRAYIDDAFAAGASDYVTKPFEIGEFRARLSLIEELVLERKQLEDRNPVEFITNDRPAFNAADVEKPLHISGVDCVIDYLVLGKYILQLSRASVLGNGVFGISIQDAERRFLGSSDFEFRLAMTDVAEAISETLKPHKFFVAHAGGGVFVCVIDESRQFDTGEFSERLDTKLGEMELHFCDGRPMVLNPCVGKPISLDLKSPWNAKMVLQTARLYAIQSSHAPHAQITA